MTIIHVPLEKRAYHIRIGALLHDPAATAEFLAGIDSYSQLQWVTNTTLAKLYAPFLQMMGELSGHGNFPPIVIEDGESHKSWQTLEYLLSEMLRRKLDRKAALIAFGGGVVGDITGFAASIYQRGIAVMQIPTTLLSMVDSSVGGKTAINHPLGKNMIGAMHQPSAVWIDPAFLHTLPEREYRAGLAEVVKYGCLGSADFFAWLEKELLSINAREPSVLTSLIATSCQMKADIVLRDENEQGERALLNFGHSFGHAIESLTHYRQWLHGEAVAMGMVMASDLSRRMGYIADGDHRRIIDWLAAVGLPTHWQHPFENSGALTNAMLQAMSHDKKVQGGKMRLILLQSLGQAIIHDGAPQALIAQAIIGSQA